MHAATLVLDVYANKPASLSTAGPQVHPALDASHKRRRALMSPAQVPKLNPLLGRDRRQYAPCPAVGWRLVVHRPPNLGYG